MSRFLSPVRPRTSRARAAGFIITIGLLPLVLLALAANPVSAQDAVLTADFSASANGFNYSDRNDPTGTNYVSGEIGAGQQGNGLVITLGGLNDDDILDMSGTWSRSFTLTQAATTTVRFDYRLELASEYESDEFAEARLGIDGAEISPASGDFPRLAGDGNGGAGDSLGWSTYSAEVDLGAGQHRLDLIGFSNKKTFNDETVTVRFDNVEISVPTPPPPTATAVPPTATAAPLPTATPAPPTPVPTLIPPGPAGTQTPMNGPHVLPAQIEAEDFDFGGPDIAYGDESTANIGTRYRDSQVDVYTNAGGAGYVIGNTRDGEWVEYTVESEIAQTLDVTVRVSTGATAPGSLQLDVDGTTVATLPIDRTGGWWTFSDESFGVQRFSAGTSVVRITWLANGSNVPKINLDRLNIGASGPTGPTCAGLTQEAEDAYLPGSLVVVADPSASGGSYVHAAPLSAGRPGPSGDYAEFCFTVPAAGDYRLDARVLAPNSADDSFYVSVDNGPTALWDIARSTTWSIDSVSDRDGANPVIYPLTPGDHLVRVYQREDGSAFDTLALTLNTPATPTPVPATATPVPPTATPIPPTPTPAPDGITLFENTTQRGASQAFAPGVYTNANSFASIGNDQASSFDITAGYIALVCTNANATGTCRGFTNSKDDLGDFSLNNNISYLQIRTIGDPFLLAPGNDLTQIVNRLPAGTDFVFTPGIYRGQSIVAKDDMTFTGQPGAILDGNNIDSAAITGYGDRVEIRGLEIRNYAPGLYNGAIQPRNPANFAQEGIDWLVIDNDLHSNNAAGVNVASGMTVQENRIYNNFQIGISGIGNDDNKLWDVTIDNNEVYENANDLYGYTVDQLNTRFHEGGLKIAHARRLKVINNDFHDNHGIDIYCDVRCDDVLIDNNDITGSTGRIHPGGIVYEISTNATISNNRITTAASQRTATWADVKTIMIMEAHDVVIENNTIRGGNDSGHKEWAIGMRGSGTSGERAAPTNVTVRGNTIYAERGTVRIGSASELRPSVQYSNNTYVESGGVINFRDEGRTQSWSTWRSNGRDGSGSSCNC